MASTPVFTAIVHTYNRPALLREAVSALLRQTYPHLEIILINNGAVPQSIDYLNEVAAADKRVNLIHFAENQFSWDDPHRMIRVCYNAALAAATGDYVWIQDDDDVLAEDYAEKMVALFQENSECTTAAGLPVSIDIDGNLNPIQFKDRNVRSRYTPGQEMALNNLLGDGGMFAAPGTIFTIKRDILVHAGGYHNAIESSQLYGIVPFGVTGFDPNALFYWRHHQGQLNNQLTQSGWLDIDDSLGLLKDWDLEERWSVFGADVARRVVGAVEHDIHDYAARKFLRQLFALRLRQAFFIFSKLWLHPYFWYRAFALAGQKQFFMTPVWEVLMPPIRTIFRFMPGLARISPRMSALHKHVTRLKS